MTTDATGALRPAFRALGLDRTTPEQALARARDLAAQRDDESARLVARRLLREAPSYHDARALLGRTFSWERRFDDARRVLDDLVRRAPAYADGLAARIELEVYQERGDAALAAANQALGVFPRDPSLLYDKARALELLDRRDEALRVLDDLHRIAPTHADADILRARLQRR
jgi:tetratricopeptide (TPR) repeat protein